MNFSIIKELQMGKVLTIYLDDISSENLEKVKNNDADFNLSAFIQSKLSEIGKKEDNIDELNIEVSKKEAQINFIQKEVEFLKQKINKKTLEIEGKNKAIQEQELKKEKSMLEKIKTLKYFYDVDDALARNLINEFDELDKDSGIDNIYQLMLKKGYKERAR